MMYAANPMEPDRHCYTRSRCRMAVDGSGIFSRILIHAAILLFARCDARVPRK